MGLVNPFDLDLPLSEQLAEGDVVRLGPGAGLAFEVVALRGDKAWVRDLNDERHGVVDVATFRCFGLDVPGMVQ